MENLVDIGSYCNFLSSITHIDIDKIQSIVILYFSGVANGSFSFGDACSYIENELVKEMASNKRTIKIQPQKQKELAL